MQPTPHALMFDVFMSNDSNCQFGNKTFNLISLHLFITPDCLHPSSQLQFPLNVPSVCLFFPNNNNPTSCGRLQTRPGGVLPVKVLVT